jgi:hypothetical protein
MKSLTIFCARYRGTAVARALASSYAQASLLLCAAKIAYDEVEDCGPEQGVARAEYNQHLPHYLLAIDSPREISGKGLRQAVEQLLRQGYLTTNVRLLLRFVATPELVQDLLGQFQVLKNQTAFRLDTTNQRHLVPA